MASGFGPSSGCQGGKFGGIGFGQAFEDMLEVFRRINSMPTTTAQHRINNRTALARLWVANEQKVLFADGRWPDRIFAKIIIQLQPAIVHVPAHGFPP